MTIALDLAIEYPDSDRQPTADNTVQSRWIVLIKENLEYLFLPQPDVFVAGDLLWYLVEGRPEIRVAPDVMVSFGRPKGERGSYRQWQEDQVAPQVVFEILSPGDTTKEMSRKLLFYNCYGVEEYYIYDPDHNELTGLERVQGDLTPIETINGWVSPRLQIRFELTPETLNLYDPQDNLFLTPIQLRQRAEHEAYRAEQEAQRADQESRRADEEKARADRLAAKLQALGINVDEQDA